MVLVRDVQIPQQPVQEFSSIVGVEKILPGSVYVNGEAGLAKLLRIRARPVGWIV